MSLQNDLITQYANANWVTQYLGADGLVHNRLLLTIGGHRIDLGKILNKSPLSFFFGNVDNASVGFAQASKNMSRAIEENKVTLREDRKTLHVYLRATEKLNRLH